jgi:hypothetical protein
MKTIPLQFAAWVVALATALPSPHAHAEESGVRAEIRRDMAEARQDIRNDMARERVKLDSEDLSLHDSLRFRPDSHQQAKGTSQPPAAVITANGDFLIEGAPVKLDAKQRSQVLAYRRQVIALAKVGIDGGERAAMAALEATDVSMFSLIAGGLTGSLERRIEASTKRHVQPFVLQICRRLPALMASQQALSASVPEFRPYASLEPDDVAECEGDVRDSLAAN